jgi:hypothetical protein
MKRLLWRCSARAWCSPALERRGPDHSAAAASVCGDCCRGIGAKGARPGRRGAVRAMRVRCRRRSPRRQKHPAAGPRRRRRRLSRSGWIQSRTGGRAAFTIRLRRGIATAFFVCFGHSTTEGFRMLVLTRKVGEAVEDRRQHRRRGRETKGRRAGARRHSSARRSRRPRRVAGVAH